MVLMLLIFEVIDRTQLCGETVLILISELMKNISFIFHKEGRKLIMEIDGICEIVINLKIYLKTIPDTRRIGKTLYPI